MLLACIITNILAIALPSLRISPLLLIRIATIVLLHIAVISICTVYIQSIGSDMVIFSGLFHLSLVPVKPGVGKPKWLSKEERAQFTLSRELKDILIGLCLGDLHIQKEYANARLMFVQGALNKEYLDLLYQLFSSYCSMVPKTGSGAPNKRTGLKHSSISRPSSPKLCLGRISQDKFLIYPVKKMATDCHFLGR